MAERQDSTSFWAGTGVGEDLSDLGEAIGNGSWLFGSLAGVGLAGDVVFTVFNPIAAAVSAGLGWLIEHIHPLDEMLEKVTGDADAVMAGAQTWRNIAEELTANAADLRDYVTADFADQAGQAADAWRSRARELSGGLDDVSGAASGIAKGLEIAAAIVQFVHDMVRDTITEAFGMLIQAAAEEIFSLGLLTPLVAYQTYSWIATRVTRLSGKIKDLITSISGLSRLLRRVPPDLTSLVGKLNKLKQLAPSNLTESAGRGIGRGIKNHMGGLPEVPVHAGSSARAARGANNLDGPGTTTSTGGTSGGSSSPGGTPSGSGSPGSSYHGLDPIHGDTSKPPASSHSGAGSSAGSTSPSSSAPSSHTDTGGGAGAGGSSPSSPGSPGGAGNPGTSSGGGYSTGNSSYHGIDPIHGDIGTSSSASSAHGAAHTDAGSAAESQPAGSSGPHRGETSTPDASTDRTEASGSDAGGGRAGSGNSPAEADGAGSMSGSHAGADASRSAPHDTTDTPDTAPTRTGADQADGSARDGSRPGADQDTGGRTNRADADQQTSSGAGGVDGSDTHASGRSGSGADVDTRGRSGSDTDGGTSAGLHPSGSAAARTNGPHAVDGNAAHAHGQDTAAGHTPESRHSGDGSDGSKPDGTKSDGDGGAERQRETEDGGDGRRAWEGHTAENAHGRDQDHPRDTDQDNHEHQRDQHHGDDSDGSSHNGVDPDSDADIGGEDFDVHNSKDVPALFEYREEIVDQRNILEQHLGEQMPEGHTSKDFNADNRDDTIARLGRKGYDPDDLDDLQTTAKDLTDTRREIRDTSAHIGEVGGEKYLAEQGTPVLDEWAIDNNKDLNNGTVPGGYTDGASRSTPNEHDRSTDFYEEEYKGATAKPSSKPVRTHYEGNAKQGSQAYARDHLLTDPRYAQYFHDHPRLWEDIKNGNTQLHYRVISTRTPDGPPHIKDVPFDLVGDDGGKVRDHLQRMIDDISAQSQQPPTPEAE
ncbi:hypothetical protein [Actinomyces qiguomingii]|uniref:hypothetical protein n=1 Tax=Actinomyces qiguomingii TaxID=2057800 RepID=UPI0011AFBAAC|nr:hypothetical protein [Actinomyces qiguomingii]